MRFDLKRYLIPFISGVLGIAIIIIAVLGFTVLRPANTVTAIGQTKAQGNAVYTKAGVLSIYADPVTISVKSEDNAELVLVVGKSYDISAYAEVLRATEIKGLKTWEKLELSDISQAKQDGTPEPESIKTSDLWDKIITGKGKVSLTIPGQTQGLSALIFSDHGDKAFTVSIDWQHKRVQYWPWVLLGLGVLILLGSVAHAWISSRKHTSEDEKDHLDEADEQLLSVEINETVEESAAEKVVIPQTAVLSESDEDLPEADITVASEEGESESLQSGEDDVDDELDGETSESGEDEVDDEPVSPSDYGHSQSSNEAVEDQLTTESGRIISIHTATKEIRLPSRGALRIARERGQKSMELDGVSYATGAIPLVDLTSEDNEPVEQIEVSEVLPDEVENMIQDAVNAGTSTGVRPGESLWQRLCRYRSAKSDNHFSKTEDNIDGEENSHDA